MAEDAFDSRRESREAKYKLDEERRFKTRARRDRLLGLWAAERMGLGAEDAQAYAREIVMAGMEAATDEALVAKVREDLDRAGLAIREAVLLEQLARLQGVAQEQIDREFPHALDNDHRRVGD